MMTLNERQARFHDAIRHEWTDDVNVNAWRKWSRPMSIQTRAATDSIIRAAQVTPGMDVLDIASGTGEPALTLAETAGRVTATDLGPQMLLCAEENARARGVGNVTFTHADVHDLPFGDASFDRVTCRFGIMYFANVDRALGEIRRVLRPDGRAALLAWGSPDQPFITATVNILFANLPTPPPPPEPDAPTPFRFAQPGSLTAVLERAGFRGIDEQHIESPLPWPGPAEELCKHFFEVAAPFRPILESFGAAQRQEVFAQVIAALRRYEKHGRIEMNAKLVVASAVR
jgi:SAM-dependent methyltransferase